MRHRARASVLVLVLVCGLLVLAAAHAGTQPRISSAGITTPEQQFGAAIGDDFFLASYTQLEAYWKQLDRESDRLSLVDIGRTEEGRTQSALADAVMFAPPFSGPFNYVLDPLVPAGIELAGAAIHARFAAEGKPGVTMRSGSPYSPWWNGGLRTTANLHNQIGLLTEIVGGPTPMTVPLAGGRREPHADLPFPIEFSFDVVYPPALADGALTSRCDVIVLPGEAVPVDPRSSNLPPPAAVPDEYRDRIGEITAAVTVPALRQFVGIHHANSVAVRLGPGSPPRDRP